VNDPDVITAGKLLCEAMCEFRVELDGGEFGDSACEVLGEGAVAGPDFEKLIIGQWIDGEDDLALDVGIDEEILAEGFPGAHEAESSGSHEHDCAVVNVPGGRSIGGIKDRGDDIGQRFVSVHAYDLNEASFTGRAAGMIAETVGQPVGEQDEDIAGQPFCDALAVRFHGCDTERGPGSTES
jgi:hypothetical protein